MLASLIIIKIISYTTVVSVKAQSRIVNGTKAADGEFPFIASLRSPTGKHFCGSSILNEMWILTAAHCVYGKNASSISVQYGSTKISKEGPTIVNVSRIVVHEGYEPSKSLENDVALLEMHSGSPIVFNVTIQPVKLPEQFYEAPAGSNATLAGWGLQKSGGSIQEDLQKVELITFSDEECFTRHNATTVKTQLCAGVPEGGKGQCNGDSGGPLIVDGKQLGIVSWSRKPCTVPPYPGVLTKVSRYVDWILKQMSKEELSIDGIYS